MYVIKLLFLLLIHNWHFLPTNSDDESYKNVKLKCRSNSMYIDLETKEDFTGVIYTRGSFHDKQKPCFLDPGYRHGQRSFSIQFPLDKCKTRKVGNVFSNVLVVQSDKDLIMPGDAAFKLECNFEELRNITVATQLNKGPNVVSKITVTKPDVEPRRID